MAKIQLGSAPKTFAHTARFPVVDGTEGDIRVQYVYRDREQFAAFIDELYPEIKAPASGRKAAGLDVQKESAKAIDRDVQHIMGCVQSWDLADELTPANVRLLCLRFPAGAAALIEDYARAINEGRTGN